jgi:hypothetical protein
MGFAMEQFFRLLASNWLIVSQAPLAFALLAASMFALAYIAAAWRYSAVCDQIRASNDTLKERLHLKTEQAEQYKDRALKYDEKVSAVVDSDAASLATKAMTLVAAIHDFVQRHRRSHDAVHQHEWRIATQAKDDDERTRTWQVFTDAMSRVSTEKNLEWDRRFKVDTLMLRDELRSRLPNYKPEPLTEMLYEHPTNDHGYSAVAADLERMSKLLLEGAR